MKLLELWVRDYKNLKNPAIVKFDFTTASNYVALVGLNGSGKSNVIEAISIIFASLYHNKPTRFRYCISYMLGSTKVVIIHGKLSIEQTPGDKSSRVEQPQAEHFKYLPSNVIASYSGEELRMWEGIYLDSYADFFRDIKKQTAAAPKLLYINKYCWEFALIALLSSENPIIRAFTTNVLGIGEDVEVQFTIEEKNYGSYADNDALSFVKRLASLQRESATGGIPIQTIATLELGQKNNKDLTQKLFYYLFITGMPEKSDKVPADKIIRATNLSFNDITVKNLSEGEKKLILIYAINHILADDKTLVLLDEPDAHIHIERKKEIIEIIDQPDRFTVFTTHSAKMLSCVREENIRLIKNTPDVGLEVVTLNKVNALSELTNGEFSIIDATIALSTSKDILLVEGEYDLIYINEAIKRLNIIKNSKYTAFNFLIINCGGAGNVPAIFREIIAPNIKPTQFCIATFDSDKAGKDGIKSINKYLEESPMPNVAIMTHTKPPDWEQDKEFYMEDYFPIKVYKDILLTQIESKTKIKDFQQLSKDTVKSIIMNNYKKFDDSDFVNFEILLDDLLTQQSNFHNPLITAETSSI